MTHAHMDLTPVVLSFNHPDLTRRCLESVLKFFPPERVLLVHNGSRDEVVTELQSLYPAIQHEVILKNRGYSGGANHGISSAFVRSSMAFLITNDCELLDMPASIELDGGNGAIALAPRIMVRQTNRIDSVGGVVDWGRGRLQHVKQVDEFLKAKPGTRYLPGSAMILTKEAWQRVGGFRESLHTYWEDVEWSVRAEEVGVKIGVEARVVLRHGGSKTTRKNSFYTTYLYQRNRRIISRERASKLQRLRLEIDLASDFVRQMSRLLRSRRWTDVGLLWKAHFSS